MAWIDLVNSAVLPLKTAICASCSSFVPRNHIHLGCTKMATMARQEQSGCRVHIERQTHEVRLYGPDENLKVADRLLKDEKWEVTCQILPKMSRFITELFLAERKFKRVAENGGKDMTPKYVATHGVSAGTGTGHRRTRGGRYGVTTTSGARGAIQRCYNASAGYLH